MVGRSKTWDSRNVSTQRCSLYREKPKPKLPRFLFVWRKKFLNVVKKIFELMIQCDSSFFDLPEFLKWRIRSVRSVSVSSTATAAEAAATAASHWAAAGT